MCVYTINVKTREHKQTMTKKSTSIAVRVPADIADALEALARQQRLQTGDSVTRAAIVRQAIDDYLKRQQKQQ